MITETILPGREVWVLSPYSPTIKLATVDTVESGGVRLKGNRVMPTPFGSLFNTRREAVDALLARAADEVRKAEQELLNAQRRWRRLKEKYSVAVDAGEKVRGAAGE